MEKIPLTPNQREVLNFLNLFYEHYHYMPTQKEIGAGDINEKQLLKSRTDKAAEYLLKGLQNRGWIKKELGKHRAIILL